MRSEIVNYIKALTLGTFKVSSELPFNASGDPLFQKNKKSIYVDNPQTVQETLIPTLDNRNVITETTSVMVYFTTDAKQLPSNYASLVSEVKLARNAITIPGYITRECDVSTEYSEDVMVTQFEFRFTKLT